MIINCGVCMHTYVILFTERHVGRKAQLSSQDFQKTIELFFRSTFVVFPNENRLLS